MKEIATARDCWPTQTEFQMNSPRRKLAIEKRESDKLSLKVFLGALSAPNRQIRVQRFVITVSLPYSRTNGGEPKTCSQRISTRDRRGTLVSTTNAASRFRLGSRHSVSSGYTRYGVSKISLETASVSPLSNSNG